MINYSAAILNFLSNFFLMGFILLLCRSHALPDLKISDSLLFVWGIEENGRRWDFTRWNGEGRSWNTWYSWDRSADIGQRVPLPLLLRHPGRSHHPELRAQLLQTLPRLVVGVVQEEWMPRMQRKMERFPQSQHPPQVRVICHFFTF